MPLFAGLPCAKRRLPIARRFRRLLPGLSQCVRLSIGPTVLARALPQLFGDPAINVGNRLGRRETQVFCVHLMKAPGYTCADMGRHMCASMGDMSGHHAPRPRALSRASSPLAFRSASAGLALRCGDVAQRRRSVLGLPGLSRRYPHEGLPRAKDLAEIVLDAAYSDLRTGLILVATRRAGDAKRGNDLVPELDGDTARKRRHVGQR